MAAVVMRRDLAVCREQSGGSGKAATEDPRATLVAEEPSPHVNSPKKVESTPPGDAKDVAMQDAPPSKYPEPIKVDEKPLPDVPTGNSPAVVPSPKDSKSETAPELCTAKNEEQPNTSNGALHIETTATEGDIKAEGKQPEEKAPDTATGDLDSLFNDPISAEGASSSNAFSFEQNNSNELDFSSFGAGFDSAGADNDNISSLLPGLEDYANTQTNAGAELEDFSAFFNSGDDGQNQADNGEQRDTTFDDLMDLANFEPMDGDDNGGNMNHADLDFESLFK